jgi:hypothetical protein
VSSRTTAARDINGQHSSARIWRLC